MKLKLIEPLRELFRDKVRILGRLLSIPAPLVQRHTSPGPGLAIRIIGPVTREQAGILQQAGNIFIEEVRNANIYSQVSQAFAVLLPVNAVGVMGGKRTYEQVVALRAVQSEDFMTQIGMVAWSLSPVIFLTLNVGILPDHQRVNDVNRVTYDISSEPLVGLSGPRRQRIDNRDKMEELFIRQTQNLRFHQ
ncbi:hypothetical protein PAXINDRAFT_157523 [Paxillus involutus ATCC 200175]|uniref:GMP synthase (glutamine-hydrolyzing) n=1 Tax=Paxillus involutus ATCC 200175 TaxID=664439 RepID=A0A0C9SRX6_PAXIN|nr:hypothetical protein PAXINDRAFT_157523 [Paxillus involutus ATCC 200175]